MKKFEFGITPALLALFCASSATAQESEPGQEQDPVQDPEQDEESTEERLRALEDQFEALAGDVEGFELRDVMPPVGEGVHGLGPASSKVYHKDSGISIGGYGELRYKNFSKGNSTDEFDLSRAVLYFGYKFSDKWVFNSEIEFEHADETFVEFAYLDYLHQDSLNFRGGLVLSPMGLVNELHEPTTYLAANRSLTESYIIPSTWRENGLGVFGELGGFDYRAYLITGFDGAGFGGKKGLRGGRQKGSKALAEDIGVVARFDWTDTPGLLLGTSAYFGDAGQNQGAGDMETTIVEVHADYRSGPFWGRALIADASVDDRDAGDMDLGGWYVEAGWDLMNKNDEQSLYPFLRYEDIDTDVSAGGIQDTALTFGLHYQPHPQIVFKLDHTDYDDDADDDVTTFLIGYVF